MIEAKIDALIVAIEKLTIALVASPTPPAAKPAAPKAAKPAKPAKSEEEIVQEVAQKVKDEEPETTATKYAVSNAVQDMLKANKRNEAIALLGQFGAKSVSGIKESDYAAFLEGANEILMTG